MWRRANKAVAGIAVVVAAVPLAMIAGEADGPAGLIIVPPVGGVPTPVPPVTVADVAAVGEVPALTVPAVERQLPSASADSTTAGQTGQTATGQAATGQTAGQLPWEKAVSGSPAQSATQPRTSNAAPPPPAPDPPPPVNPAPSGGQRIVCPDPRPAIPVVPAGAQAEVAMELRYLDAQLTEANRRLVEAQGINDPNYVRNAILGPLASRRVASLDRIAIAIGRYGPRPTGLARYAECALR